MGLFGSIGKALNSDAATYLLGGRRGLAMKRAGIAEKDLYNALFNQRSEAPPVTVQSGFNGIEGLSIPQAGERRIPSLQDAAPALAKAQMGGANITPYVELLKGLQPRGQEVINPNAAVYDFAKGAPVFVNRDPGANNKVLSPGQVMFGPDGKPIADVPMAPQIITASPESNVIAIDRNAPAKAPSMSMVDSLVQQLGGVVTSGMRTPDKNAKVGGVANSYHLTGQARDIVPPPGMSMQQLAQVMRGQLPGMDVINEKDHVHIEPGRGQGGVTMLQRGQPKPEKMARTLSPNEVAAYGFLPGTVVQMRPDGSLNTVQAPNTQASPRKAEADLRKEFNARAEVKDYRAVEGAYNQIRALTKQPPSAAADISTIFSFMKMLDPGSVVREGEFATAQNAAGVPDQVVNAYNKALQGQRLNPKQRQDFLNQAQTIYRSQNQRFRTIADEYRGYASDYGVDPNRVAEGVKAPAPGAQQGKDGQWYIQDPNKKGSFPQLRQGADGKWRIKSANGQILEWED